MNKSKISITMPTALLSFIDFYSKNHNCSRSRSMEEALKLLQQKELAKAYREANNEIESIFELSNNDGL